MTWYYLLRYLLPLGWYEAWSVLCHLDDDLAHMLLRFQVRIPLDGFLERKDLVHDRANLARDEETVHVLEPQVPISELCAHRSPTRNHHSLLDRTDANATEGDGFVNQGTDRYTFITLCRRNMTNCL